MELSHKTILLLPMIDCERRTTTGSQGGLPMLARISAHRGVGLQKFFEPMG
jgi:hypothetical protein